MTPERRATSDARRNPLRTLADHLQSEDSVISPHVVAPSADPVHGPIAAAGPLAAAAPEEYALVVEAVREGYLLHYGQPRLLDGHDDDLALLAGDYLYALGIERLGRLGDDAAIAELSDLISLSAQVHAEGRADLAPALWLAAAVAVGCGAGEELRAARDSVRAGGPGALVELAEATAARARECGVGGPFGGKGESINSVAETGPSG